MLALYVATTVMALVMTYREQRRMDRARPGYTLIGYIACTVWPLVAVVFLVSRA